MKALADICPGCASGDVSSRGAWAADTARPTRLSLRECGDCGLAWQFPPARTTEESEDVFTAAYDGKAAQTYFDPKRREAIARLQSEVVATFAPPAAEVLDIGAGDGAFVRAVANRGLHALGVDPAAPEGQVLPNSARLVRGTLEALEPGLLFDVVTAFDVIEHVEDPGAFMAACLSRLRPGGLLFLETGNFKSADRIGADENWWCFQADHRWYFAPDNLASFLRDQGLASVALWPRTLRPGASTEAAAYAGPSRGQLIDALLRRPWTGLAEIGRYRRLKAASRAWPLWAGLPIFLLVATSAKREDGMIAMDPRLVLI